MKILITGGAGFIGSHLVRSYAQRAEVVVLDNLSSGSLEKLKGTPHHFVQGDVRDLPLLQKACKGCEIVVHLAAMVSVVESVQNPADCLQINTLGTLNVLQAARDAGAKRVIFASSAAVYGDNPASPKEEAFLPQPRSPYAISKLDGEYWCDFFTRQFGLSTIALRFFNVYGNGQNPDSPYAAAVPCFLDRALNGQPLTIYGDGQQTRDFIHVRDLAAAIALAEKTDVTGVFNVGSGNAVSIQALAETLVKLSGSSSPILYESPRPGDVRHSTADIRKIQGLGFQPKVRLEDGLKELILEGQKKKLN
ncbi:MAG: NAD-dependent epimerase/dehydratase family protein [bacterium]